MKIRSRKPKPAGGMELTLTLSLPPELDVKQSAAALITFFDNVKAFSQKMEAIWLRVHCAGIPGELEERLQAAVDASNAALAEVDKPKLWLVVDNAARKEPSP